MANVVKNAVDLNIFLSHIEYGQKVKTSLHFRGIIGKNLGKTPQTADMVSKQP